MTDTDRTLELAVKLAIHSHMADAILTLAREGYSTGEIMMAANQFHCAVLQSIVEFSKEISPGGKEKALEAAHDHLREMLHPNPATPEETSDDG